MAKSTVVPFKLTVPPSLILPDDDDDESLVWPSSWSQILTISMIIHIGPFNNSNLNKSIHNFLRD